MHRFADLLEFYSILHRIVKGWQPRFPHSDGPEGKHLRLNTFGVIRALSDWDADNLKKNVGYTNKTYFFSRPFHDSEYQPNALRVEYPGLAVRENDFQNFDPLDGRSNKRKLLHSLTLIVADQVPFRENSATGADTTGRTIEEVGNDVRTRMSELLLVMGRFHYFTGYLSNTVIFEGWYDEVQVEQLKTDGVIDQYIRDEALHSYVTVVNPATGEVFYEVPNNNLCICTLGLTVETSTCFTLPSMVYDDPVDPVAATQTSEQTFQGETPPT